MRGARHNQHAAPQHSPSAQASNPSSFVIVPLRQMAKWLSSNDLSPPVCSWPSPKGPADAQTPGWWQWGWGPPGCWASWGTTAQNWPALLPQTAASGGCPLLRLPYACMPRGHWWCSWLWAPWLAAPRGGHPSLLSDHTLPTMAPPCPQSQPTSSWEMVSLAPAKGVATHDGGGLDSKPRSFCRRSTEGSY